MGTGRTTPGRSSPGKPPQPAPPGAPRPGAKTAPGAKPPQAADEGPAWLSRLRTPRGLAVLVVLAGAGVWLALSRGAAPAQGPTETFDDVVVVDEDARPIPGAIVDLHVPDPSDPEPKATARADEHGVAHLRHVGGAGPWRLELWPPRPWDPNADPQSALAPEGFMKRVFASRAEGKLPAGWYPRRIDDWAPAAGPIVLRRWVIATVRVVEEDPKDQAIPDVPVRWRIPGADGDASIVLGRTDTEGRCRFPLPVERLAVTAWITDPQVDGTETADVTTALPAADLILRRRAGR